MALRFNLDPIWYAICELEKAAEAAVYRGGRDYDRGRAMQATARDAKREYNALSAALPRLRELQSAYERQYDRHVTSAAPEGCSCHINPPCGYCTREADAQP